MNKIFLTALLLISLRETIAQSNQTNSEIKVMDGFPPSRDSQVTFENYRTYPYNQWSFRNIGAPLHVIMVPRSSGVHSFKEVPDKSIANFPIVDANGKASTFENIFKTFYTDGVIVTKNNSVLYENYWNGLSRDYQHLWFSITKSLTSTALGILVEQNKIDLSASPALYITELKGSAYERATIQDVLNMSTGLGFREDYIDSSSYFWKYYASAMNFFYSPGNEPDVKNDEVLGTYDFLSKKATADEEKKPGYRFEYNSSNADVIGWLISRISGRSYADFIHENIWAKIGAEHDAYLVADRAYMGVATGGMNTTLRDAALFGNLILNKGSLNGKQIVSANWVNETLKLTKEDKERYARNDVYVKAGLPWVAYKNFWWILDETKGEYCGVGIHGQVIYINRSADMVIAYFSSQPDASSASPGGYKAIMSKLNACRGLAKRMSK
jgi:CubicO group peptidase (beta-lactamase class C family)